MSVCYYILDGVLEKLPAEVIHPHVHIYVYIHTYTHIHIYMYQYFIVKKRLRIWEGVRET